MLQRLLHPHNCRSSSQPPLHDKVSRMKSPPSERPTRRLLHTRQVVCTGYERSDGLYEIEGRLTDSKADDSDMAFKYIRAGEPIHQMHLTLVIDLDLIIHGVEASTEAGPTPYCHEINAAYDQLVGIKIRGRVQKARHTESRRCPWLYTFDRIARPDGHHRLPDHLFSQAQG